MAKCEISGIKDIQSFVRCKVITGLILRFFHQVRLIWTIPPNFCDSDTFFNHGGRYLSSTNIHYPLSSLVFTQ